MTSEQGSGVWRHLRAYRRLIIILMTPLCLSPLLIVKPGDLQARCTFMLLLMAVYWLTEALPLGVTGMIPIVLAPVMGLLTSGQVASNYMKVGMIPNVLVLSPNTDRLASRVHTYNICIF